MVNELDRLYFETEAKPGCPGTRVDEEGREWYSDAWLDGPPTEPDAEAVHVLWANPDRAA